MCLYSAQKAKKTKANSAEIGGDDDEEESTVSNSSVADSKKEEKKERLMLKKPPEEKKKTGYIQWYKSYMIRVRTSKCCCTLNAVVVCICP